MTAIIIILSVFLIIFLLLSLKITIEYNINIVNYKVSSNARVGLFGGLIKIDKREKTNKDINKKNEEKIEKDSQAIGIKDLLNLKDSLFIVINRFLKLTLQTITIESFETEIMLALPDPFTNGIAYGAVSGVMNLLYIGLKEIFNVKKYFLDISNDFNSGEGLILKNNSKLSIRPSAVIGSFINLYLMDKEFRQAFLNIIKLFKEA